MSAQSLLVVERLSSVESGNRGRVVGPESSPLRIGPFSRKVGLSAAVLRAWEARYGLFSPARTAGGYRLYGAEEATRVRRMRAYLARGLAPAESAQLVLAERRAARARPRPRVGVAAARHRDRAGAARRGARGPERRRRGRRAAAAARCAVPGAPARRRADGRDPAAHAGRALARGAWTARAGRLRRRRPRHAAADRLRARAASPRLADRLPRRRHAGSGRSRARPRRSSPTRSSPGRSSDPLATALQVGGS